MIEAQTVRPTVPRLTAAPGSSLALLLGLLLAWGWLHPEQAEYCRALIQQGEWWRVWTGQFAHWGLPHLLANLAGLLFLGAVLHRSLGPLRLLILSLLAAPAASLALGLLLPEMEVYRGASGLLWAWGGAWIGGIALSVSRADRRIALILIPGMLALPIVTQMAGVSLTTLPEGITGAWPAHIGGFAVGLAIARPSQISRRGVP